MGKRQVLVTSINHSLYCSEAKGFLKEHGLEVLENRVGRPLIFEELKELMPTVDAVVADVDTWNESIFKLPPKLKIISRFGTGVA